jgi:hypothetical protein
MNGGEQASFDFLKRDEVRRLNDQFRKTGTGGRMMVTRGIAALPLPTVTAIVAAVRDFNDFGADNDPYGEHDFGSVDVGVEQVFWKIDYYDKQLTAGSEDPADPTVTTRVLTIMLAAEY